MYRLFLCNSHLDSNFRTCLELAEVCRDVALPPGVLNILTGLGPEAGAPLASHPHVDKVWKSSSLSSIKKCIILNIAHHVYPVVYCGLVVSFIRMDFYQNSHSYVGSLSDCIYWKHCNRNQNHDNCSSNDQGISLSSTCIFPGKVNAIFSPSHLSFMGPCSLFH